MAQKKKKTPSNVLGTNRKARFNYFVDDSLECGIVLQGTEVKSLKASQFSFTDSYVEIVHGEMFLNKLNITKTKAQRLLTTITNSLKNGKVKKSDKEFEQIKKVKKHLHDYLESDVAI